MKNLFFGLLGRHINSIMSRIEKFEFDRNDYSGLHKICLELDNFIYRVYLTCLLPLYEFATRGQK